MDPPGLSLKQRSFCFANKNRQPFGLTAHENQKRLFYRTNQLLIFGQNLALLNFEPETSAFQDAKFLSSHMQGRRSTVELQAQ